MSELLAGTSWTDGALLLLGVLLSSAFAAAEAAVTTLPEARVRELMESSRGRTRRLLSLWLAKPQETLTAALIGRQSANIAVAVSSSLLAERLTHSVVVAVVVAVIVVLVLVFGEVTPRSFARQHAARLAPPLLALVWVVYVVTLPVIAVVTRFTKMVTRGKGGGGAGIGPFVTESDIRTMIQLGRQEGVIDKQEGRMLTSIIELGDTLVREVMVPRTEISALPITATSEDVLHEAREKGHSRMPVFDDSLDEVKGFFHSKDLLEIIAEQRPFSLKDHLRPVLFVPELMRVTDLLKLFQRKKTHLAVVVDEFGGTAGIVALEDVLEEIVGPIQDEHDEDERRLRKVDDGHYLAEGRTGLYELSDALGVSFPADQGYETVGGFLLARIGRMAQPGERVGWQGWCFIVKDADEKRIARVEIERSSTLPPTSAEGPPTSAEGPPLSGEGPIVSDGLQRDEQPGSDEPMSMETGSEARSGVDEATAPEGHRRYPDDGGDSGPTRRASELPKSA